MDENMNFVDATALWVLTGECAFCGKKIDCFNDLVKHFNDDHGES